MTDPVNTEAPAPAADPLMPAKVLFNVPRGQVLIDLVPRGDAFGIELQVSGALSTLEVAGLLHIALKQHIDAKHATEAVVYQTPDEG
jgi:hypothetical protein